MVGPHPVRKAFVRSGDLALLALAEPHLHGLNRVSLAYLDGDTIRYAGLNRTRAAQPVVRGSSRSAVLMASALIPLAARNAHRARALRSTM